MKEKPTDKQPVKVATASVERIQDTPKAWVFTANVHFGYGRDFKAGQPVDHKKLSDAEIAELKKKSLIEEK